MRRRSAARVIVALVGAAVLLLVSARLPRETWASHCTQSAAAGNGVITTLTQLTSRPNNEVLCNTANSRSDSQTAFPGFSPYLLFKAASGSSGTVTGPDPNGNTTEMFSVTMVSFINLTPGDITGNMFARIMLFSTNFNKAPNVGPFMTDPNLQSINVPCGSGTGDGVPSGGSSSDCPNASNEANTSGTFTMNPAMTITSFSGNNGPVSSFQLQLNNIATTFGATAGNTEGFVFNSGSPRLFDFGGGAAIACAVGQTCLRQGFTQFNGGALRSASEAPNDAAGTTGSRVTIEAAFAVTTLASGLHIPAGNQANFQIAFHQLISQGDFQMNTLGSFRANTPAFMPAATYPTGLSLSSSTNFLLSQVAVPSTGPGGVIFLTRTPGTGLSSGYGTTFTPANCLPGFLSSSEVPQGVLSTAFNGAFLFRGAFGDFSCPAPP